MIKSTGSGIASSGITYSGATIGPGSTIGIVGGGQLGRMTALAAARLGYRSVVLTPESGSPGGQVADHTIIADYVDPQALDEFVRRVDVVTYEFENVPSAAIEALAARVPVRPGPQALATSQHRMVEKKFAAEHGVASAPFRAVTSLEELRAAVDAIGRPAVLKTCRFGYDGKGQVKIDAASDLAEVWGSLATDDAILEGFIAFEREISVIAARGLDGEVRAFPPVENRHENHILATTTAPADIPAATAEEAVRIATRLIEALEIVGLLAVEMFVLPNGSVLMNEIAPRPHNSGHWTQDGCRTCQFEQLVRAICGLPLGSVEMIGPTVMQNLIGYAADTWPALLAEPGAKLHLYGKAEARPGRKMGHVNRVSRL